MVARDERPFEDRSAWRVPRRFLPDCGRRITLGDLPEGLGGSRVVMHVTADNLSRNCAYVRVGIGTEAPNRGPKNKRLRRAAVVVLTPVASERV